MPRLLISTKDSTRSVPLAKPLILGRSTEAELSFPEDSGLSRQHMIFEPIADAWSVRDLGSKNGTRVNGTLLHAPHRLDHNDQITASYLQIVFKVDDEQAKPESTLETHRTVLTSLERVISRETSGTGGAWNSPAKALLRAGGELALRRPLSELFPVLLNLAMEAVSADRGVLMTLDGADLTVRASSGGAFAISSTVRDRVLLDRQSMLIRSIEDDQELQDRLSIRMNSVLSLLAAPLQLADQVIGLIYVDCSRTLRGFTEDDLNLLTVIGNIAAIRIEQERLAAIEEAERRHQNELQQAAEIQRRHLPSAPPEIEGWELAGRNTPCHTVGGDYFDFLRLADGRLAIFIADVAGKGMPASLLMMSLQARVQALAESSGPLDRLVARLNRSLAVSCPSNRFVTMFVLVLDPASGEFSYVNAGHNVSLLMRSSGAIEELGTGGIVLGLIPAAPYTASEGKLDPGDSILLYTDGISEAESPSGEEFDLPAAFARLRDRSAAELLTTIETEINVWTAGAPPADDRTLVFLRRL